MHVSCTAVRSAGTLPSRGCLLSAGGSERWIVVYNDSVDGFLFLHVVMNGSSGVNPLAIEEVCKLHSSVGMFVIITLPLATLLINLRIHPKQKASCSSITTLLTHASNSYAPCGIVPRVAIPSLCLSELASKLKYTCQAKGAHQLVWAAHSRKRKRAVGSPTPVALCQSAYAQAAQPLSRDRARK
eukprot:4033266-Amphidinium_carterae.2